VLYPLTLSKFGSTYKNAKGKTVPMPRPKIVWRPIIEEDRNMRAQRLTQLLQAGAISVNEIRMKMGFDRLDDPKFDKVEAMEPAKMPTGDPDQDAKIKKPAQATPAGKTVK